MARHHFTTVAGKLLLFKIISIVPSSLKEAIALSTLLRRKAWFASIAAPTSVLLTGSGAGAISLSLAKAGSAFCKAQNEGAHTNAAPTDPRSSARRANSSDDMG